MSALGVLSDAPPTPHQPKLADGIHLRWAFDRDLGFPWHGFYLFRRQSRPENVKCLSAFHASLVGRPPSTEWRTPFARITSDVAIVAAGTAPAVELPLAGRKHIRFAPPAAVHAAQVTVRLGGSAAPTLTCTDFATPQMGMTNPIDRGQMQVVVASTAKKNVKPADVVTTHGLTGLDCRFMTEVVFRPHVSYVRLTVFHDDFVPTFRAFDRAGEPIGEKRGNAQPWKPYTVEFSAPSIGHVSVEGGNAKFLQEVCYSRSDDRPRARVRARAFDGKRLVAETTVEGFAGAVAQGFLRFDRITAVEVDGGSDGAVVDVCFDDIADATQGWEPLKDVRYPITLPVDRSVGYPAPGAPADATAAKEIAIQRIRYGIADDWRPRFGDIHGQLVELVKNGKAGGLMANRTAPVPADPPLESPPLKMPRQRPLDLLLLGALNPAIAQLLGLYHVDTTAPPGVPFDYLIVADHDGWYGGNPQAVIDDIRNNGFRADAWIAFHCVKATAPPLPPPQNVHAYALPGATKGDDQSKQNGAGLVWTTTPATNELPTGAVMYHLWRHAYGSTQPSSVAPATAFAPLTLDGPILVTRPAALATGHPTGPPDWPPLSLHTIDPGLPDGWYGYRVSGIDLFGRFSALSADAEWRQWTPAPAVAHPFAIALLDKLPPPPPTAIEAFVLDDDDPFVVRDTAYIKWRASVTKTQIGLRVRWRWPQSHATQAPDAKEFRVYFHLGSTPPPNADLPASWSARIHVQNIGAHVSIVTEPAPDSSSTRLYEVFLLAPSTLSATLAAPLAYAQVSVSTADDKTPPNEGRVGVPATVYLVRRDPPETPEPTSDAERVFASRADYYNRSYYTYRWREKPHLKLHVYRALDESVFLADWTTRPRTTALTFPNTPRWNAQKKKEVTDELAKLDTMTADDAFTYYRTLGDDLLRILASQPEVENAFAQITIEPLDPADPATNDRLGPDNPDNFAINTNLRAHIDSVDGRARNRYFYRSAYVDSAQNRSAMSAADPPVYLPKVEPPRAPVITKVVGGDRKVTMQWAASRDPDVTEYRVYRAENSDDARDLRLMSKIGTLVPSSADLADGSVAWSDSSVVGNRTYIYRLTAADATNLESLPSTAHSVMAVDTSIPLAAVWVEAAWVVVRDSDGGEESWPTDNVVASGRKPTVRLVWTSAAAGASFRVSRKSKGGALWRPITVGSGYTGLSANTFHSQDFDGSPRETYTYRVIVASSSGLVSDATEIELPAVVTGDPG